MSDLAELHKTPVSFFDAPVFSEGFRVFFPLTALYAALSIILWGLVLSGVMTLPINVDPVFFHQYELFFGFLTAAMAGFLTTAVPSWTSTPRTHGIALAALGMLWLAGRLVFWAGEIIPPTLIFGVQLLFPLVLLAILAPRMWRAKSKHLLWPVSLLTLAQAVCAWEFIMYGVLIDGLALAEGAFAIMVLTALAPISMVIVNDALSTREDGTRFIARPPFRRAAILCISALTLARVLGASEALQGWLALAAACSVLNILRDWHIADALRTPFSKSLYALYWFIAAGFALQAGGLLEFAPAEALVSGEHMIFIGGFSLATLMVLIIAGLRHSGRQLNLCPLLAGAIICMILAVLTRAFGPLFLAEVDAMPFAWGFFAVSFLLYLIRFIPIVFQENA